MDFSLNDEQQMIQEAVRKFARDQIMPHAHKWEAEEQFPLTLVRKLGSLGYLGVPIPEEYGGTGLDYISEAIVFEEVGYADSSVRTTLSVQMSLVELTLLKWATEDQKQQYLPGLCSGEIIGCFGLTEPDAGSDAANVQTTAVQEGDEWVLNGQKVWISNGTWANLAIIFAQTQPGSKHRGMAAFLVDTTLSGYSTRKMKAKLGLLASDTGEIYLDNVRIPDSCRLGEVGEGFKIAMSALDNGRFGVASGCVGTAQRALDVSIQYSKERIAFSRPIASFQMIQDMLAQMKVNVEAARLLVYQAGWVKNQGKVSTIPVSIAKYYASEIAKQNADMAIQVHGGYGYSSEYVPERLWRDCRVASLYEGTSQIQKLIIGRDLTGISAFD
jgi:butyryl-CoA dehydrogenase